MSPAELLEKGHELFETQTAENNPYKKIEELEKIMGKQTVESRWGRPGGRSRLKPFACLTDSLCYAVGEVYRAEKALKNVRQKLSCLKECLPLTRDSLR